ncbi:amino acid permease [Acinetobacter baumannii]|uniref:amino acid permease n=1 Tax=Acinetobacter baumannii TaxID=470 RepID=UPI00148E1FFD|nr:amino acid permease [Acinetobacter baumannii]
MNNDNGALKHALSNRQVSMITLGGIVGAGLFVVSATALNTVGPAILISYALTGLMVLFVMRMLGEMAIRKPDSGAFSTYASESLGHWAGFTIGWLYWWFWVLVVAFEAILGANIFHHYFPEFPSWLFAVLCICLLACTNLMDVRKFGEFEFWFALIKVLAIVAFILFCIAALMGFWPLAPAENISGVGKILEHGGLFPNGYGAIFTGMLISMFTFFGVEMLSILAAESKDPARQVKRATNIVIARIGLFYIISIFLVLCIVPWNAPGLKEMGTFQYVLHVLNVPGSRLVMDVIVFIAVTSVLNSGLYTASRMLYSLSQRGDAAKFLSQVSQHKVPQASVLTCTAVALVAVVINYTFPEKVFMVLLSTMNAIGLLVYLVIAMSQIVSRSRLEKQGVKLDFKMWFFPWLSWFVVATILTVLGYMFFSEQHRYETMVTLTLASLILIMSFLKKPNKKLSQSPISTSMKSEG